MFNWTTRWQQTSPTVWQSSLCRLWTLKWTKRLLVSAQDLTLCGRYHTVFLFYFDHGTQWSAEGKRLLCPDLSVSTICSKQKLRVLIIIKLYNHILFNICHGKDTFKMNIMHFRNCLQRRNIRRSMWFLQLLRLHLKMKSQFESVL